MKTKKTLVLLCLASLWIQSCSDNKNSESESTDKKEEMCDCSQIKKGKGKFKGKRVKNDTLIYSGKCQKTDNNDSIINLNEYSNGEKIHEIERKSIYGQYVTIKDLSYDVDGKVKEGFVINLSGDNPNNEFEAPGCKHVSTLEEWKSGKCVNKFSLYTSYYEPMTGIDGSLENGRVTVTLKYFFKDGKEFKPGIFSNKDLGKPKCLKNAEYTEVYLEELRYGGTGLSAGSELKGDNWSQEISINSKTLSFDELYSIFDCLKTDLPKFNYYIKK